MLAAMTRPCPVCGQELGLASIRAGAHARDGRSWAIFGECADHGLVGAPEGAPITALQAVDRVELTELPDLYAGWMGERVALWRHFVVDADTDPQG